MEKKYDTFTAVPTAKVTFDDCEDLSQKITIFTGYEYTYYVLANHDTSTDVTPESKYLILEYADAEAETHSLYVSLETNEIGEESSKTDDMLSSFSLSRSSIGHQS